MKYSVTGLILLAILFTTTLSAPVERGDAVLHHPSSHRGHRSLHRGLSHRMRAALAKRPLNLTFTPIDSGVDDFVHVEYGTSTQLQTSHSRFSATLLMLGRDDEVVDAERSPGDDTQVILRSPDTYEGRHIMISIPDPLVRALKQRGVSQDNIPQYVRQNVHVADPNTGNQYQLVPDNNPEEPVSIGSNTIMITLNLISALPKETKPDGDTRMRHRLR